MVCINFAHASLHPSQRHTCMYSMYTNICGHLCAQMSNDAYTCTQVLILCTITIVCTYMYNSYLASSPQPASQSLLVFQWLLVFPTDGGMYLYTYPGGIPPLYLYFTLLAPGPIASIG